MDIVYIVAAFVVPYIFLTKRELLIEKESFRLILGISIALFVAEFALHFTNVGRSPASGGLLCPLLSLLLYRLLRKWFIRWFKHEPRDTFLNWESGLAEERIFNILYWTLSLALFMLAVSGMRALPNASL